MESSAKMYTDEHLSRRYREFRSDKNIEIKHKMIARLIERFTTPIIIVKADLSMVHDHKWINAKAEAQYSEHKVDLDNYIRVTYDDLIIHTDA